MTVKDTANKINRSVINKATVLALNLKMYAQAVEKDVLLLNKVAAFEFFAEVVKKTPVDTGRLRANFQIDTVTNTIEILSNDVPIPPKLPESTVYWVFNNIEYLIFIEQGHSSKRPQGIIRLALQKVNNDVIKNMKKAGIA